MIKGYIDNNNDTLFVCPNCGFQKRFSALPFKEKKRLTIKCQCGVSTDMLIEFRQFFRKPISLPGVCLIENSQVSCDVIIKDLSLGGVSLEFVFINKKYLSDIEIGDIVYVEFQLDNAKEQIIRKKCAVKTKVGNTVGGEFLDDSFTREIRFYMME
ncbi:MAG: PilZ domain-containing protein [Desulfamplus sp.]|nr:PilZ domain-containing protein [Desulfamplus sp.]